MKRIVLFFIVFCSSVAMVKSQNCQFLCNGDFENPSFGHWTDVPDTLFQCWKTTESDSIIEVWWTGYNGVPAYSGNQFVELNANAVGTLYQNFTIAAGTQVTISFAHRGRAGVDTMSVSIGPVGGPYVTIGKYADGNQAWGYYTVNYTIPIGHGNYYSLRFNSIYAAGGNPTIGNFLDDISVTIYPQLMTSLSSNNIMCYNQTDGSATVTVSSGVSPYTYSWSPSGGTSMSATGLSAGVYTCLINDANGCATTDTVIITQPAQALNCNIPAGNGICSGGNTGSATANVSGGTSPYTYNWSPGGQTTASISNLSAGTYMVTVKDANNCTIIDTVTLNQGPLLNSSIPDSTNIICNGGNTGSAAVNAGGGTSPYTYSWSPGGGTTSTASNLSAGTYTVTIKDANGCTTTNTITITQPPQLNCNIPTTIAVSCNGANTGSATASAGGGTLPYTYNWSPGGGTISTASSLSAGVYTVTVYDSNGCTITAMTTITQPPQLKCSIPFITNISCNGGDSGSATANASGGTSPYRYYWSPGGGTNNIASNLSAGTYTVTVNDSNGCAGSALVTIVTQPPTLFACCDKTIAPGGFDTIVADSSVHYKWSPPIGLNCDTCQTVIASPTITTTYTVTGTDANGCTLERIITVTVESNLCSDFIVPNVFTPNNDGVDDQLVIKAENIDKYSIVIYDRWGKEMYKSTDPTLYWNGLTESGGEAPEGIYYYLINSTCQGNTYKKDGFVQLIR